ncbi:MAG: hypothetical protein ABR564_04475 [Candidatus Dormibacteria bacterium]
MTMLVAAATAVALAAGAGALVWTARRRAPTRASRAPGPPGPADGLE